MNNSAGQGRSTASYVVRVAGLLLTLYIVVGWLNQLTKLQTGLSENNMQSTFNTIESIINMVAVKLLSVCQSYGLRANLIMPLSQFAFNKWSSGKSFEATNAINLAARIGTWYVAPAGPNRAAALANASNIKKQFFTVIKDPQLKTAVSMGTKVIDNVRRAAVSGGLGGFANTGFRKTQIEALSRCKNLINLVHGVLAQIGASVSEAQLRGLFGSSPIGVATSDIIVSSCSLLFKIGYSAKNVNRMRAAKANFAKLVSGFYRLYRGARNKVTPRRNNYGASG